jgi:hypothetical protein
MKDEPLNAIQVQQIVGFPINMMTFPELAKINDVEDIFKNDCCLINYLSAPYFGHWCCCVRKNDTIYYFNPTGRFIDEALEFIPEEFRKKSQQDFPHLIKLFLDNNYKIKYMDKGLQGFGTNTCGRWCALFMRMMLNNPFKNTYISDEEEFIDLFKNLDDKGIIYLTNLLKNI